MAFAASTVVSVASATPRLHDGQTYGVPSPERASSLSVSRAAIELVIDDDVTVARATVTYAIENHGDAAQQADLVIPFTTDRAAPVVTSTLDGAPVAVSVGDGGVLRLTVSIGPHRTGLLVLRHAHDGGDSRWGRVAVEGRYRFTVAPERWASFAPVDVAVAVPAGCDVSTTPVSADRRLRAAAGPVEIDVSDRRGLWFGWNDHTPYFTLVLAAMITAVLAFSAASGHEARRYGASWKRGLFHLLLVGVGGPPVAALAGYMMALPMPQGALGMEYGLLALLAAMLAWPLASLTSFASSLRDAK